MKLNLSKAFRKLKSLRFDVDIGWNFEKKDGLLIDKPERLKTKPKRVFLVGDKVYDLSDIGKSIREPFPDIFVVVDKQHTPIRGQGAVIYKCKSADGRAYDYTFRDTTGWVTVDTLTTTKMLDAMSWLLPVEMDKLKESIRYRLRGHLIKYKVISSISKLPEESTRTSVNR